MDQLIDKVQRNDTRTEAALRASELSYRRLFEAAQDGILILDVDTGRINDVNPFLVKMLNFSHAELTNMFVWDLGPAKDLAANKAKFEQLQAEGCIRYENLPLEAKNGHVIAVEFVSNIYQAGDHNVIQCNVRDITQRKEREMASTWLAAIIESSNDAIISKSPEGIITTWNKGAERIFGYAASEIIGTSLMRLIPDDRRDEEVKILEKIKRGESLEHFETVRKTKDGGLIAVSVTVSPIKDAGGKVVGVSKVARDITERKAAAEKISQLNFELEHRVIERTAQLQSANDELQAFSYSVSHDLRTPLRHIMGFVELLQKEAGPTLSEKNLRHLATVSKAAKRMGNLIDDLLAFSRIGQSEMQKTTVNLDELARQTMEDFHLETHERKIIWDIQPLPVVQADRALLRLALVNLMSNAVKFTSHRADAKIEIGCAPGRPDETVIFIRDNGAGYDPRYADKLFCVFQRLHNQEEFEGTGIGLANVQRIIHRHGGRVWAEGAVDKGATFYFSIPQQNGDTYAK